MDKANHGFFAFSLVTKPDEHRSFNEWHLFDHLPENAALRDIAHGQRWVCPPAYEKLRLANAPELAPHQYLTLYLFSHPVDRAVREFIDLRSQLEAQARFHRHRKASMSGLFLLIKSYAAARVLVSPESLPYRPNKGIYVTVEDVVDPSHQDAYGEWIDRVHVPDMLTVKHVAGISWFSATAEKATSYSASPPTGRAIRVHYLDGDPEEMLADLKVRMPQWRAAGRYPAGGETFKPVLASLYRTIEPWSAFDWFD